MTGLVILFPLVVVSFIKLFHIIPVMFHIVITNIYVNCQKHYINKPPSLDHIRVFGCLYFVSTIKQGKTKFDTRSKPYLFLDYPPHELAYKNLHLHTKKIIVSRDVNFHKRHISVDTPTPHLFMMIFLMFSILPYTYWLTIHFTISFTTFIYHQQISHPLLIILIHHLLIYLSYHLLIYFFFFSYCTSCSS